MSIFDKNAKQINGPINIIRMEGEVNSIKKVIYIFMDQHISLTQQTECDNVFAKDIDIFFAENFSKLNDGDKIYDFFLEIMPTNTQNVKYGYSFESNVNYRDIYILEVVKLFRKLFKYEPKKNKVTVSKYFRNVRLHYMDVRDYFEGAYFQGIFDAESIAADILTNQHINPKALETLIQILSDFKIYTEIIRSVIRSYKKNTHITKPKKINLVNYGVKPNVENQKKIFTENIKYIIYKTFIRYSHKNIQQKLSKQMNVLDNYLSDLITSSEYILNEFESISNVIASADINKLTKQEDFVTEYSYGIGTRVYLKMLFFIRENIAILSNKSTYFFTRFMDVYFLRRFLDKDYITNAITYTGSYHSTVYIEILSKDFGFKITNFFYSKITDINRLNVQIKKLEAAALGEIFYPEVKSQCSDLSDFPDNFS